MTSVELARTVQELNRIKIMVENLSEILLAEIQTKIKSDKELADVMAELDKDGLFS